MHKRFNKIRGLLKNLPIKGVEIVSENLIKFEMSMINLLNEKVENLL